MQEMKARYASGMQLYCQKANVMLPSSVSSTSTDTCGGMVSKGITPVICTVIPQYFQLAFAFLSCGKKCRHISSSSYYVCLCIFVFCVCLPVSLLRLHVNVWTIWPIFIDFCRIGHKTLVRWMLKAKILIYVIAYIVNVQNEVMNRLQWYSILSQFFIHTKIAGLIQYVSTKDGVIPMWVQICLMYFVFIMAWSKENKNSG